MLDSRRDRTRDGACRLRRRAIGVAAGSAALFVIVYVLAVWTPNGQKFEDAVLNAAQERGGTRLEQGATDNLGQITVLSVTAAIVVVVAIGLARRRLLLAGLAASVNVVALVTVEVAQRLLVRPILLLHGYRRDDQSFPSGHAAIALSIMCSLVMVVPYRLRGFVVLLTAFWASGVTVATVTAGWHLPSDTIGSALVVLFYSCLAIAVLAARDRVGPADEQRVPGRLGHSIVALALGAVLAAVVGAVVGGLELARLARAPAGVRNDSVFVVGQAIALGGGLLVALTLLALIEGFDLGVPSPEPVEEHDSRRRGQSVPG